MNGRVAALQALIDVTFQFEHRPDLRVEFVIDTGFAGYLTMPPSVVEALRLPFLWEISANLANDSDVAVNVHAATILWDGEKREVEVLATGARPLLGTLLLEGYDLRIQFAEGGGVSVESL